MRRCIHWAVGSFVLAIGLGVVGCSTGGSSGATDPAVTPEVPGEGVQVKVKNEQRIEVDVWVSVDGARRRLGRVASFGEESFLIPMDRARVLQMEFRIFGGETCVTREVPMLPGEEVFYTIPVEIRLFDAVCR